MMYGHPEYMTIKNTLHDTLTSKSRVNQMTLYFGGASFTATIPGEKVKGADVLKALRGLADLLEQALIKG